MSQEIIKLLEITDTCPADFYKNPEYLENTKQIVELAKTLVHEVSDEGRIKAKSDVAAIRKYVKTTDSFTLGIFRSLTDKIKTWRDEFTWETKRLSQTADEIMAKFEVMEAEQLAYIRDVVSAELANLRTLAGIREEFMTRPDLAPLIKLSGTLTPNQKLTSKANKFLTEITYREKEDQSNYDSRLVLIKLRCLESDINPPLDPEYFGQAIYEDYEIFNSRLSALITIELDRREQTKQRIIKQQEEETARKIAEAVRLAELERQKPAEPEPIKETEIERLNKQAARMRESAQRADRSEDRKREMQEAQKIQDQADNGSRLCRVVMTFEMDVKNKVSLERLEQLFINEVTLSEKAKKSFINVVGFEL